MNNGPRVGPNYTRCYSANVKLTASWVLVKFEIHKRLQKRIAGLTMGEDMYDTVERLIKVVAAAIATFLAVYIAVVAIFLLWFEWLVSRGRFPEAIPILIVAAVPAIIGAVFGFIYAIYKTRQQST